MTQPDPRSAMIPDQRARVNVATYATYPEAQRAVDYLSDQKFPVERTAIVGEPISICPRASVHHRGPVRSRRAPG